MYKKSLNDNWTVKKIGGYASEEKVVSLPHDAMIEEIRTKDSPAGPKCGFFTGGEYEYSKKFFVSEKEKAHVLEFEGMYNRGQVYVNGDFVGSVHYGYTRLLVDITGYLKYGEENEVFVKVSNSTLPNSRWYTGSGIYRPVSLYVGNYVRIGVDGLKIHTQEIIEDVALVETAVQLIYDRKTREKVRLYTVIKDAADHVVAEESTPVTLYDGNVPEVRQRIYVKGTKLWSVEKPYLYTCEVKVMSGNEILDEADSTFGIRKITVDPVHGMLLNGEQILLRGTCIHHDNGPLGAAALADAEARRVRLLKEAGFNAIRVSHNSASKAILEECDRQGMLLLEESFDMWNHPKNPYDYALDFADFWEKDIEDIVAKDFNHPCVFMYSIGNEIPQLGTPAGAAWNRKIAEKVRSLDSTRLVTNAMNGIMTVDDELPQILLDFGIISKEQRDAIVHRGEKNGDINDIMTGLNGSVNKLAAHQIVTDKLEEACSGVDVVGCNYMRDTYDVYKTQFPNRVFFGSETLPPDIDLNWSKVKEISACIGDFTWTGWDYIGEAGVGVVTHEGENSFLKDYPTYLAYCGDIDIVGNRRPMSYYREIVFGLRKEPYIAVLPPKYYDAKNNSTPWAVPESVSSWEWTGFEGKPCKVEVFSHADEVELLINGNSCGKMPAGEENRFKAIFDVKYLPGKLEAVAYKEEQEIGRYTLQTPADEIELQMEIDRTDMSAGSQELSYIMLSLVDKNGRLHTYHDRKIKISVEGSGVLKAFGSADPLSTENFFDMERTTYFGKALAIVQAGKEAGTIKVTAQADDCESVSRVICVK